MDLDLDQLFKNSEFTNRLDEYIRANLEFEQGTWLSGSQDWVTVKFHGSTVGDFQVGN
jgi:hypothetical protein